MSDDDHGDVEVSDELRELLVQPLGVRMIEIPGGLVREHDDGIDRQRLTDVLDSAIHAQRTRVLVVAPEGVRAELTPSMNQLGIDYRWETGPECAVRACQRERFEVALVHAAMSSAPAVLEQLELRGRRERHSVVLFSTPGAGPLSAGAIGVPVLPLREAIAVLRQTLDEGPAGARG